MKFQDKMKKIAYGGDYNPEQWQPEVWEEDRKLLKGAGVDIVTLNVFNWAMLQPNEETYDFSALDTTVQRVTEDNMHICMATSTAAHPAWMARKYPDVLRTEFNGMKRKFGGRHNSCPNSPTYQKYSAMLAGELAKHYREQDNIVAWHISNEYGGACYCENCEKAFRVWLRKKYGTLEQLNREWNTHFWGRTYYDWEDIVVPNLLSEHFEEKRSMHQGITLDYMRFNSDSMLENFKAEAKAIKAHIPDAVVTTNLMGQYKPLDYKKWAQEMDIVSWDNYPESNTSPAMIAMNHDLMRGLKEQNPFLLMEQTPGTSNWLVNNALKRPGVMRLQSLQAVAHGADSVMFFQMRRSPAGCEKFHSGMIDHAGTGNTRVYRECAALGQELNSLGDELLGARTPAKAALIFDWDTWWAVECSAGPTTRLKYTEEIYQYYQALHALNVPVDIIGTKDDLTPYQVVAAPLLYMVKDDIDKKLESFAAAGGTVIFSYMSGYVNENDYITIGGYPGKLREMAGIWVEEIDALSEGQENTFEYQGERYSAQLLCDVIHAEGAEVLTGYLTDFYAGSPVVTRNSYGQGQVYYIGTRSSEEFYQRLMKDICEEARIELTDDRQIPAGVEMAVREKDEKSYRFLLNHTAEVQVVTAVQSGMDLLSSRQFEAGDEIHMQPADVLIICENQWI